jgi:hypothetical protein
MASIINSSAPFNPRSLAAKIILLAVGEKRTAELTRNP